MSQVCTLPFAVIPVFLTRIDRTEVAEMNAAALEGYNQIFGPFEWSLCSVPSDKSVPNNDSTGASGCSVKRKRDRIVLQEVDGNSISNVSNQHL